MTVYFVLEKRKTSVYFVQVFIYRKVSFAIDSFSSIEEEIEEILSVINYLFYCQGCTKFDNKIC